MNDAGSKAGSLLGSILLPLVLAQFICSYAGSISVATILAEAQTFGLARVYIIVISFVGPIAAILLPPDQTVRLAKKGAENDTD